MIKIISLLWCALFFPFLLANDNVADDDETWRDKVIVIPLKGEIAPTSIGGNTNEILDVIKMAHTENAERIIMEIDSPGGLIDSCDEICAALIKSKIPTTAVILRMAVSGGAMVATACQEIYMVRGSRIGDIQPMNAFGGEMSEREAEKIEADVRAIMAVNARENNYPQLLLEAMVTRSFEIYEVNFVGDVREFLTAADFALLKNNMAEKIDRREFSAPPKIVVQKDKLLSVEAHAAVEFGIAKKILNERDEIFSLLAIAPEKIINVDIADGEIDPLKILDRLQLSNWVLFLLIVFLVMGIAGTFTEIHLPGFGVPGAMGLIGFACFFYVLFAHGRAEWYELALFIMGIIFLVVEIVILPGFGVCGVIGAISLFAGLTLAILPDLSDEYLYENWWSEISVALAISLGTVVAASWLIIFALNRIGARKNEKDIFLSTVLPDWSTAINIENNAINNHHVAPNNHDYQNAIGIAITDLRPAGKIKLADGVILDVVSNGEFIDKNSTVKINRINDNHFLVSRV